MHYVKILFWSLAGIVLYTYIGYAVILYLLVKIKRIFRKEKPALVKETHYPEVTLFITAYNERDYVEEKVQNSLALDYPKEKLQMVWVTDGSTDGTPELLSGYPSIQVYHTPERKGKIHAMNRGMQFAHTPIVIFSDANTMLGKDAIKRIARLFQDPRVGCVSGEKRIKEKELDNASGAGEGLYWKYESALKKWDAELYSVVGAAGELFAIRTELFQEIEPDTLLDDFIISLRVAQMGYTIQYDPEAYAIESASANVKEELKRKIRIAAGGIQSVVRLRSLLNIFRYKTLSFQYISHRVLRWTITPIALLALLPVGFLLSYQEGLSHPGIYTFLFILQLTFYTAAFIGSMLENRSTRIKLLFIPYYFFIMNYSVFLGFARYMRKQQSVNWERAQRAS